MTPDDETFRRFIAKALEIQAQKEAQALSAEEMRQIAASMGIAPADLEMAFDGYWQRGNGFARLANWDDAIEELQQAAALKPDRVNVLFALANAHGQRWQQTGRRADQEQALALAERCAELDPNHFGSLQLISSLKAQPRNVPALRRELSSKRAFSLAIVGAMVVLVLGSVAAAFFLTSRDRSTSPVTTEIILPGEETSPVVGPEVDIKKSFALLGPRGPVYWLLTAKNRDNDAGKRVLDYELRLLDPRTEKTLKSIALGQEDYWANQRQSTEFAYFGGKVYETDEKNATIIARDLYTGEIVEDNASLAQRYPALQAGIGKLRFFSGWFELVTTKGEKYWYAPSLPLFASDADKQEVDGDYREKKGWQVASQWCFTREASKKLYILEDKVSPYRMRFQAYADSYEDSDEMLQGYVKGSGYRRARLVPNLTFINAKMVFASAALAVIIHATEVGAKAKPLLTCVDSAGNVRWYNDAPTAHIFTSAIRYGGEIDFGSNHQVYRHGDKLVISHPYVRIAGKNYPFACELDLQTGKIGWEYSPTAPKTPQPQ
jgi:hypothetical protein